MRAPGLAKAGRFAVTMTLGDVADAQRRRRDVDAHAVEHRLQRLLGERRVAHRVAGALQPDDQPVADQLVVAHALTLR